MPRITHSPRASSTSMVVLLLCALVLAGVLAYQAQDAAGSHRRSAEQALTEYASLASWEFARHADMALTAMQMIVFTAPAKQVDGSPDTVALATLEEVAATAKEGLRWCACVDSVRAFFRFDLRDSSFVASGDLSPELQAWLARPFTEGGAQQLSAPKKVEIGQAPTRERPLGTQTGAYVFESRRFEIVFATIEGEPRAGWYYLAYDDQDRPLAVYGLEAPPSALVGTVFRRILNQVPLLPGSLTRLLPNDSLLTITVRDRDGSEIFRSAAGTSTRYAAVDTIEAPFQDLVVEAALRPEIAGDLLIGGLPSSRLPLLLALLGLTAALIVAALVQLRRSQELVRLRSNFVAGVSHELRTPLAQIRLYAELLRSGKLGVEDRDRSARVIDQEARRLSHLVENVLRFSPSGQTVMRGRVEPQDLASLVREIVDDFEPLAHARKTEIDLQLEDGIVAAVDADAVRQLLLNLLDNGVKYGPVGQRVTVGMKGGGDTARLWVDDEGPGIPEAEREHIWEPYRRLESAVASGTGGSGIGLAVVREIAALHGGRASVGVAPSGGARFLVELPALAAAPAPESVRVEA